MSVKPLVQQDIKKICLICGCHTNQAINIYEPRSGPNIIELIQAKFKFQPVNEDKFLCFSCNNWLINWHSLQVLNTKESDENHPSGKSRLNNSIPEETENYLEMFGHNDGNVQEQQPIDLLTTNEQHFLIHRSTTVKKRKSFYFSKRDVSCGWNRINKIRRKSLTPCSLCGKPIFLRSSLNFQIPSKLLAKCKNCRRILKWRIVYLKTIIQAEDRKLKQIHQLSKPNDDNEIVELKNNLNLVMPVQSKRINQEHQHQNLFQHQQKLRRPLVDGKVVSMLRRLGTTLTREGSSISDSSPIIMSPAKKKPQKPTWKKQCLNPDDDEDILIDFNTAISEVLPMVKAAMVSGKKPQQENIHDVKMIELNDETKESQTNFVNIYDKIPKCVTVSVINMESS